MQAPRLRSAVAAAALAVALAPASAAADDAGSVQASSGTVAARLSWTAAQFGIGSASLAITGPGQTTFEGSPFVSASACAGQGSGCSLLASGKRDSPLQVADLDGDGAPEVLVDAYTGGAHCCAITVFARDTNGAYAISEHQWGDPGYELRDADGDGRPDFVTADDRFAGAFTAYAGSVLPLQVLRYDAGTLSDITRRATKLVRADLARIERGARRSHTPLAGLIPARTAELYLLGRASDARSYLERGPGGRSYKRRVLAFLKRTGYR